MKQCPRCKSQLAKTRNQKLACKVCGFVTKQLEVAANNEEFQDRHHFGKKITFKQSDLKNKHPDHQQSKHHYLFTFQNMLREAAITLFKSNPTLVNIEKGVKEIWIAYVKSAHKNKVKIIGIFTKLNKNKRQAAKEKQQQAQKQQESDGDLMIPEYEKEPIVVHFDVEQRKIDNQSDQNGKEANFVEGKKRARKGKKEESQKQTLKTLIKKKFLQFYRSSDGLSDQKRKILDFIFEKAQKQEISNEEVEYCSQKYVQFLAKLSREGGNTKFEATRVGIRQLRGLLEERRHGFGKNFLRLMEDPTNRFGKKIQIMKMVFMLDLLIRWGQNQGFEDKRLDVLLQIYEDEKNTSGRKILDFVLQHFKKQLANEIEESSLRGGQAKQAPIPELSFTLVYAIIYCAALRQGYTLSIDEIVASCRILKMNHQEQIVVAEQRITENKIRKASSLLYRFLDIPTLNNLKPSLRKWVEKYCGICKIDKLKGQIKILSELLYDSYVIKKKQKKQILLHERYDILEQDIIAKASIAIYVKIQLGFDETPYLATFPKQLVSLLDNDHRSRQFLGRVFEKREEVVDLMSILRNLQIHERKRKYECQVYYPFSSYQSISGLNCQQLMEYIKSNPFSTGNMKLQTVISSKNRMKKNKSEWKYYIMPYTADEELDLSEQFAEEVKYSKRAESRGRQFLNQFDLPASNYQLFYEYLANVRHVNRKLFVYFMESIAGECRLRDCFEWMEKLERNMIDFQN